MSKRKRTEPFRTVVDPDPISLEEGGVGSEDTIEMHVNPTPIVKTYVFDLGTGKTFSKTFPHGSEITLCLVGEKVYPEFLRTIVESGILKEKKEQHLTVSEEQSADSE